LAKVIITENEAAKRTIETLPTGKVYMPEHFDYGIGEREKEIVFETLPQLMVKIFSQDATNPEVMTNMFKKATLKEAEKTYMMARVLSLKNANTKGIAYANSRKIIEEFSEPENPYDTGRPEVQGRFTVSLHYQLLKNHVAALLTYQILKLWEHLKMFRKDLINRRSLTKLVHRRAKILKYLKRLDPERYDRALERMGLEPEAVECEIVIR
jgi:small subunit ribosomal protein S15